VVKVKFTYYDYKKKEWLNEWSTTSATGFQYSPSHVRIALTVIDERGREVTYQTDARIHMTERVVYHPVSRI
jgi:general secretion pathway protein J